MFRRSSSATSRRTDGAEPGERGVSLVALLASVTIMLIGMAVAMPSWRYVIMEDREAELVFRGFEIVKAIRAFQIQPGGMPSSLKNLREARALREEYKDPITELDGTFNGAWRFIRPDEQIPQCQRLLDPANPVDPNQPPPGGPPQSTPPPGATPHPHGSRTMTLFRAPQSVEAGFGLFGFADGRERQVAQANPYEPLGSGGGFSGPFIGVMSKSKDESLGMFNTKNHYDQWCFSTTVLEGILTMDQLRLMLMTAPKNKRPKFTGQGKNPRRDSEGSSGDSGSSFSPPPGAGAPDDSPQF